MDAAAYALAALAWLILLTGGFRGRIAAIPISVTSFGRAALAAAALFIVRWLAWREPHGEWPWWVGTLDTAARALAGLACLIFLTGGVRWKVAGIPISLSSFGRAALAAVVLIVVRWLAWRDQPVAVTLDRCRAAMRRWWRRVAAQRETVIPLVACVVFYVLNNSIWLLKDASSPSWDRAAHARFGLEFLRLFQHPQDLTLLKLLDVSNYWPPFFHLCSVPFTMALGFSVEAMAATNFLFLVIAVFSIYRIGERLFDRSVGIGAVVLTLLYPMIYALSRDVLIDFALVAMVMLSLHCVLESDAGLDARRSALLGVVLGCAVLTKWTAVVFVAVPAVVWLVVCLRRNRPTFRAAVGSLGVVALVAAMVAFPWYQHARAAFLEGATAAFAATPAEEGDPTRIIDSLRWYWGAVLSALVLKPLLFPTLLGLAAFFARVRAWAGWIFLLSAIVPTAVFFVAIPNKDPRYVTPLLPLVAMMVAAGIRAFPWKAVRLATWLFIVAAGVYQFYAVSFGFPVSVSHFYTHPPVRPDWKVNEILDAMSRIPTQHPLRVAVLPDAPDFEPNIFMLDAAVKSLPMQIDGFGHGAERVERLMQYDVLVSKTGSIGVQYTATHRLAFREALTEWIRKGNRQPEVTLWRTWPLPDGSLAEAYLVRADLVPQ